MVWAVRPGWPRPLISLVYRRIRARPRLCRGVWSTERRERGHACAELVIVRHKWR
jgi:hypothetical protein